MTTQAAMLRIAPDLVWRLLDDNAVVVSPRSGEVRVLNSLGTAIWQMMVQEQSLATIEDHLVQNYEVDRKRAHEDLQAFIEELRTRGILIIVGGDS